MGFSLVFNIYDAFNGFNNSMDIVDINSDMEIVLDKVKQTLIKNGGEYLGHEDIKMKICYPKTDVGNSNFYIYI